MGSFYYEAHRCACGGLPYVVNCIEMISANF